MAPLIYSFSLEWINLSDIFPYLLCADTEGQKIEVQLLCIYLCPIWCESGKSDCSIDTGSKWFLLDLCEIINTGAALEDKAMGNYKDSAMERGAGRIKRGKEGTMSFCWCHYPVRRNAGLSWPPVHLLLESICHQRELYWSCQQESRSRSRKHLETIETTFWTV